MKFEIEIRPTATGGGLVKILSKSRPVRAAHGALIVSPEPGMELCYAAGEWRAFTVKEINDG